MQTLTIKVNAAPQPEEMGAVAAKVNAYQQERGLDADLVRAPLGIFICDEAGEIIGGLYGGCCKKAGYRVLGQLDNYPAGHTTYFMMHDTLGGPTA